jgi:hypothetical protein
MLPVFCCHAIVYFTQIHPHHLPISRFFPKDPQKSWGPQNNTKGISLVHLKYPLETRKIWTRSSRSLDPTSLIKTEWQVWTRWKGFRKRKARIRVFFLAGRSSLLKRLLSISQPVSTNTWQPITLQGAHFMYTRVGHTGDPRVELALYHD